MTTAHTGSGMPTGINSQGSGHRSRLVRYGLLVALSMGGLLALAADDDRGKLSKATEQEGHARLERIEAELGELSDEHEWAGEYYCGDGMGVNVFVALSPKNGYVFEWRGCMGVYDRNYGQVTPKDGKLKLSFTFPNERRGFQGLAEEFIPIAWGERRYLIPADDVVGFCNDINAGDEPRDEVHGEYLLSRDDHEVKVSGRPNLPAEFQAYLLDKPVKARITAVKSTATRPSLAKVPFRDTTVALDVGRADRLLAGMKLYVTKPDSVVVSMKVTKVEQHSAEAVMSQLGEGPGPQAGWELSTLPGWRKPPVTRATGATSRPTA